MKILLQTEKGEGLGLCQRLQKEGNKCWVLSTNAIGDGIIPPYENIEEKPDIFIPTDYNSALLQFMSDSIILNHSAWAHELNTDGVYQNIFVKHLETPVPLITEFDIVILYNGTQAIASCLVFPYRAYGELQAGLVSFRALDNIQLPFLEKIERMARRVGYRGFLTIHCGFKDGKIGVRDVEASLFTPTLWAIAENSKESFTSIIVKLVSATSSPIQFLSPWGCFMSLAVPPYTSREPSLDPQIPYKIKGIIDANYKHIYFEDIVKKDNLYYTTGVSGKIGYVVSRGDTFIEAKRRSYRTIHNLTIKDLTYQKGVGNNINSLYNKLKTTLKWEDVCQNLSVKS